MTGSELITAERTRQKEVELWSDMHDDNEHDFGALWMAAVCYIESTAEHCRPVMRADHKTPVEWPWEPQWWKPSHDRIRNLVKAGALIAAEIDRLQRATKEPK